MRERPARQARPPVVAAAGKKLGAASLSFTLQFVAPVKHLGAMEGFQGRATRYPEMDVRERDDGKQSVEVDRMGGDGNGDGKRRMRCLDQRALSYVRLASVGR